MLPLQPGCFTHGHGLRSKETLFQENLSENFPVLLQCGLSLNKQVHHTHTRAEHTPRSAGKATALVGYGKRPQFLPGWGIPIIINPIKLATQPVPAPSTPWGHPPCSSVSAWPGPPGGAPAYYRASHVRVVLAELPYVCFDLQLEKKKRIIRRF